MLVDKLGVFPYQFHFGTGTSLTLNDTTDKVAFFMTIPKTGVLKKIVIGTSTVTVGDSGFTVRIETVYTDGNPSGILLYANGTGTINIANGDTNYFKECSINSTTGINVAMGTQCFIVLANASALANLQIRTGQSQFSATSSFVISHDYNITSASAWTKGSNIPDLGINIDDVWYSPISSILAKQSMTSTTFANPKERAVRIYSPNRIRTFGWRCYMAMAAASTFKIILYSNPTGSPVVVATSDIIDSDKSSSANTRIYEGNFNGTAILEKNTNYALAIAPQGAENATYTSNTIDATYVGASPTGQYATLYSRDTTGTTSFTETTTVFPNMAILTDQVEDSYLSFYDRSGGKF
jgi:hypothetical protein